MFNSLEASYDVKGYLLGLLSFVELLALSIESNISMLDSSVVVFGMVLFLLSLSLINGFRKQKPQLEEGSTLKKVFSASLLSTILLYSLSALTLVYALYLVDYSKSLQSIFIAGLIIALGQLFVFFSLLFGSLVKMKKG